MPVSRIKPEITARQGRTGARLTQNARSACYSGGRCLGNGRPLPDLPQIGKPAMSADKPPPPAFALSTSRGFNDWLAGSGGSLAFTTY